MPWTERQVVLLKKLHADKKTAREIAIELGDDVSRNAVIGKLNRLGLSKSASSEASGAPRPRSRPPSPRSRITVLSITNKTCRWPIGVPGDDDFHFCGAPPTSGFPYCEDHIMQAYQPAQRSRRDIKPIPDPKADDPKNDAT